MIFIYMEKSSDQRQVTGNYSRYDFLFVIKNAYISECTSRYVCVCMYVYAVCIQLPHEILMPVNLCYP